MARTSWAHGETADHLTLCQIWHGNWTRRLGKLDGGAPEAGCRRDVLDVAWPLVGQNPALIASPARVGDYRFPVQVLPD
jgi:hypothetical protein